MSKSAYYIYIGNGSVGSTAGLMSNFKNGVTYEVEIVQSLVDKDTQFVSYINYFIDNKKYDMIDYSNLKFLKDNFISLEEYRGDKLASLGI